MAVKLLSYVDGHIDRGRLQLVCIIVDCCFRLLTEDAESGLFAVTIFRKVLDEYKLHCRENK